LQKPADGYTLFASTKSNISKIVSTGADAFIDDIEWIGLMMADPECVITYKDSEISTWEDIITDAKEKSGRQIWVGPDIGGLDHVTALKIWDKAGIEAKWIPFKSGGQAIAALLGEQGVAYVGNPRDVLGNDDLMIAAVSSETRLPQFPDVPTFKELGLSGLDNEFMWRGFVLKKGTSPQIIEWYDDLLNKINNDEDWRKYWERGGIDVKYSNNIEFTEIVNRDREEFSYYLSKLGIINIEAHGFMAKLARGRSMNWIILILAIVFLFSLIIVTCLPKYRYLEAALIPEFFIFLSFIFYLLSFTFPGNEDVGSSVVPRLWILILVALNIIMLISILIKKSDVKSADKGNSIIYRFIPLLIFYLAGIFYIGYFISTFMFLLIASYILGDRNYARMLIIAFCWLIFSYLIFYKLLYVPLPAGKLIELLL
jgi:putative tricarboxylic transport membrane protein